MPEQTTKPDAFWDDVERRVAAQTERVLNASASAREPVIGYLREVETMVRAEGGRRGTIQMVASARRVLGDRSTIGSETGPSAAPFGSAS